MLNITIERFATYHDAVNGRLLIDGDHVCDTLELKDCCLSEGLYQLKGTALIPAMVHGVKNKKDQVKNRKGHCKPSLKACNGPYGLKDGSIGVGECHHIGFIIKCEEYYLSLSDRIRKTEKRGGEIVLEIKSDLLVQK